MRAVSSGSAGPGARPFTAARTVPWPTSCATFSARPLLLERRQVAAHAAPAVVEVAVVQHAAELRQQRAVGVDERRRRATAVAGDDGGDALLEQRRQHVGVVGLRDHPVAVRVHVDESGRDDAPAAVERPRRRRPGEVAHRGDAPVADADRRRHPVAAGAVEHRPAVQEEIECHATRDARNHPSVERPRPVRVGAARAAACSRFPG
jgi:hypothetical protein